jgi:hypothetical protein
VNEAQGVYYVFALPLPQLVYDIRLTLYRLVSEQMMIFLLQAGPFLSSIEYLVEMSGKVHRLL